MVAKIPNANKQASLNELLQNFTHFVGKAATAFDPNKSAEQNLQDMRKAVHDAVAAKKQNNEIQQVSFQPSEHGKGDGDKQKTGNEVRSFFHDISIKVPTLTSIWHQFQKSAIWQAASKGWNWLQNKMKNDPKYHWVATVVDTTKKFGTALWDGLKNIYKGTQTNQKQPDAPNASSPTPSATNGQSQTGNGTKPDRTSIPATPMAAAAPPADVPTSTASAPVRVAATGTRHSHFYPKGDPTMSPRQVADAAHSQHMPKQSQRAPSFTV